MEVVGHCVGPVTLVQIPVAGLQHAPCEGRHGFGVHVRDEVGMPPPTVQTAAATSTHVLFTGQQHAMRGYTAEHPPASGQDWPEKNWPFIWVHAGLLVCTQMLF